MSLAILLPPSEAKAAGGAGPSLADLDRDARGPLTAHRRRVARAVVGVAAGRRDAARATLLLPERVSDAALAANRVLLDAPTRPALDRYTGVLYAGLDAPTMTAAQRLVAESVVHIFSGLRGVVTGDEPVPDYRVPAAASLPRLGTLAGSWRRVLAGVLPDLLAGRFVLDLRSTDYLALGPAPTGSVAVRVLTPRPDGRRTVVSYASKYAKGRLSRAVIERVAAGIAVSGADDVAATWLAIGGRAADLVPTGRRVTLELVE